MIGRKPIERVVSLKPGKENVKEICSWKIEEYEDEEFIIEFGNMETIDDLDELVVLVEKLVKESGQEN